jgi:C4-dicarboxylate transporter DctQ subunit
VLRRLLDHLEEAITAGCLAAATLIIFLDVLQRWSASIDWLWNIVSQVDLSWAQELAIYLVIWSAKFGAAYGVRTGIHLGVDMLVNAVGSRSRRLLILLGLALGALFAAVVVVLGTRWVLFMHQTGQVSYDLELPLWIVYLCIPLGAALMCLRFMQVLWGYFRRGVLPELERAA